MTWGSFLDRRSGAATPRDTFVPQSDALLRRLRPVVPAAVLALVPAAVAQVEPATSAAVYIGDIISQPADGAATSLDYGRSLALVDEQLLVASPGGVDVWQSHPLLGYHRRQRLLAIPAVAGQSPPLPLSIAAEGRWCAIGHPLTVSGEYDGEVSLFVRGDDGLWNPAGSLVPTAPSVGAGGAFGQSMDIDGATLVIGHPARANGAGQPVGGFEVFELAASGEVVPVAVITASSAPGLGGLGRTVRVSGSDLLAAFAQVGLPPGVAWFERTDRGFPVRDVLFHPASPSAPTAFGTSIALEGEWCAISAPYTTVNGMANAGAVYVYRREGEVWALRDALLGASPNALAGTVAIDDEMLAVGEKGYQEPGAFHGRVRLFRLGEAVEWIGLLHFASSGLAASDLGRAVALAHGRLAAGFRHLSWSANQSGGAVVRRVSGASSDSDGDGDVDGIAVTVHGEPDCDLDLVPDSFVSGSEDCDGDGEPDVCQLAPLMVPSLSAEPEWGSLYGAYSAPNTTSMFLVRVDQPLGITGPLVGVTAMIGCSSVFQPPPSFVAVYTDPNQDGDPDDASLVGLFRVEWPGPWGTSQRAVFPPIDVGGPGASFFVGFGELGMGSSTAMGPHLDPGPLTAGRTWLIAGPASSFDVEAPVSNAHVEEFGVPGVPYARNVYAGGLYAREADPNLDGVMDACACAGDLSRDGRVDERDLAIVLGAWGTPDADVDGSGLVGAEDIGLVLGAWGRCPADG